LSKTKLNNSTETSASVRNSNRRTFYFVTALVAVVLSAMVGLYTYSLNKDILAENNRRDTQVTSSILILKDQLRNLVIYTEVITKLQARAFKRIGARVGEWSSQNFDTFLINVPELFGFALVEKGKVLMRSGFNVVEIPDDIIAGMGKQRSLFPARVVMQKEFVTHRSNVRLLPMTLRITFNGNKIFAVVFLSSAKVEALLRSSASEEVIVSAMVDNSGSILVPGVSQLNKGGSQYQVELDGLLKSSNVTFQSIIASKQKTVGDQLNFSAIAISPFPVNLVTGYAPSARLSDQFGKLTLFAGGTTAAFVLFVFFFYRTSTRLDAYQDRLEGLVSERTEELAERTSLQQAILGSMTQGIVAFSKELKLISWNERFREIRDYPKELTQVGTDFMEFMEFDSKRNEFGRDDPELSIREQVARSQRFETHEFERQRPDGTFIEVRGGPIPGGGFVSTYSDITERKKAEQELSRQRKNLRHVLENVGQGIVKWSANRTLETWNNNYQEALDIPEGLLIEGQRLKDVTLFIAKRGDYGEGDPEALADARIAFLFQGEANRNELTIGNDRTYDVLVQPTDDGGVIVTYTDITERKKAELNLADAYNVISGSIDYAARIQRSVLPEDAMLASRLADHFVLWEPRDVVGGDIYWGRKWGDGFLIILGDCTGHGVPGAFMTLIATGALDNALSYIPNGHVSALMQRLHQFVQITLGQDRPGAESDDGLELGICYLNPTKDRLTFVGARFELYVVEDNDISVIKGDKKGIGYKGIPLDQEYQRHVIDDPAGKAFYMTTDGLIDQVGGEKKRGFGKKRFRELLVSVQDTTMSDQKEAINRAMTEYQGEERRRDDVAIIGFKLESQQFTGSGEGI